jgi:hypothetical protein
VFNTAPELAKAFPPIPVTELLPPKPEIRVTVWEKVMILTPEQEAQMKEAFKKAFGTMNAFPTIIATPDIEKESNDT